MDGLNIPVNVDANGAVGDLAKVGAALDGVSGKQEQLKGTSDELLGAAVKQEAAQQKAIASMKKMADTYGLTKSEMMAYKAEQLGITAQTQAYIDQVKKIEAKPINDAASAMENLGHGSAGFNRELIVLGHEMSQGNFSRFGGSLMVLAERSNALSLIFSGTGLAIGAIAMGIGAFVVASYQGEQELHKFNNELIATGGYAGLTKGSFDALSISAAGAAGTGIGMAKEAMQALASTGRITNDQLSVLGKSMLDQSRITGQSLDDIAKDYAKMPDGVAAWAVEHNKSMHFMSMAQYEHIKNLEDMGKTQEATISVGTILDAQFGSHSDHLSSLGKVVRDVTSDFSGLWDTMAHLLVADTVDQSLSKTGDRVNELRSKIAELGKNGGNGLLGKAMQSYYEGQLSTAQYDQSMQQSKMLEEKKAAAFTAERARINELGIAAKDYNDKQLAHYDKAIALSKALRDQQRKFDDQKAGGDPVSAGGQKKIMDGIRADYADKAPKTKAEQVSGYGKLISDIEKYNALTDIELATDAKVSANDKWRVDALAMLDAAYGKGATSIGNYLRLLDAVNKAHNDRDSADAGLKQAKDEVEAYKEYDKAVSSVETLTDSVLKQIDAEKLQLASIGLSKGAIEMLNVKKIEQQAIDAKRRADMLAGLGDEDLMRQGLLAEAAAYAELARLKKQQADETSKREQDGAYAYWKSIKDEAISTEGVVSKAFKSMEDSLVNFAKTGKLDFSTMADGIIADLIRIQIQQSITGPLSQGMSNAGGLGGLAEAAMSFFSFDGGGTTGDGSRTGGIDGKGGFMAILHPQETVIDHTKGQQMYAPSAVNTPTPSAVQSGVVQASSSGSMTINQPIVINAQNASAETIGQIRAMMPGLIATNARTITAVVQQAFAKQGMKVSI